jgi:hypothetical protein
MYTITMNHYVCSECGGVSHGAGVCQTEGCMQQGTPLKMCRCEDNQHMGIMNTKNPDISPEGDPAPTKMVDLDSENLA